MRIAARPGSGLGSLSRAATCTLAGIGLLVAVFAIASPPWATAATSGQMQRDPQEAMALLLEARQLVAADPELDFLLGEILRSQGHQDKALEAYGSALELLFPVHWAPRTGSR